MSARVGAGALVFGCLLAGASPAWAQQKQRVVFENPANSKLTQQHVMDVGDVPGHKVRIWELRRVYEKDAPMIGGARVKEQVTHGLSDYTDLNGLSITYATYVLESGDRFFCRGSLTAQSIPTSTGRNVLKYMSACDITTGTGKLQGIHGVVRADGTSDLASGVNQGKQDIEYWLDTAGTSTGPSTAAPSNAASSTAAR